MTSAAWDRVIAIWDRRGIGDRYGEDVTIGDHLLQAAALAAADDAEPTLVVAALLHDVGQLIQDVDPDERDRDHARLGAELLAEHFPPSVIEPIRLHVAAKRYLVATNPAYSRRLSPASVRTLALQGGPMGAAAQVEFTASPVFESALRVRRWDEGAKVPGRSVPPLRHYRPLVEALHP